MKKRTKRILLSISGFLLLLLAVQIYYTSVMSDLWSEEKLAVQRAKQYGGLVSADKTYKSVWDADSIYWVVTGKDEQQQDIMVWVQFTEEDVPAGGAEKVHSESLSSGLSETEMRNKIKEELPNAAVRRLLPGVYEGEYVWQLMYSEEGREKYRFYRFQDGEQIGNDVILPE